MREFFSMGVVVSALELLQNGGEFILLGIWGILLAVCRRRVFRSVCREAALEGGEKGRMLRAMTLKFQKSYEVHVEISDRDIFCAEIYLSGKADEGVAAQMEISSRAPCRNHSLCGSSRGGTAGLAGIWTGTYVAAGDDGTGICSSCIGPVVFAGSRQPVGADPHFAAGLCIQHAVSQADPCV